MISEIDFNNLKIGDRVNTGYSGLATVVDITKHGMIKLNCDFKKWSCPYFYRSEIKEIIFNSEL